MKRFVYADNAATTQISPEVLEAMMPWLTEGYGNPSSIYELGRSAGFAHRGCAQKGRRRARRPAERDLLHRLRLGER